MNAKRGQAAIEYVALVGTLLIFLIPVVYYALNESSYQLKVSQLDNAVRRVSRAIDSVYAIGPGAQEIVIITLPQGIESAEVGDAGVHYQVSIFGGISDFGYDTIAPATIPQGGTFPTLPGTYRILVRHTSEGIVEVMLKP
jgi:uncharacterized protein (UPF0333 family)